MAEPITINLSPVTFHQLVTTETTTYRIAPFDSNGNLVQQQIFEIDVTNDPAEFILPLISTLGASNNLVYTFVLKGAGILENTVRIKTLSPDTIGAIGNLIELGSNPNSTLGFKVASNGVWTISDIGLNIQNQNVNN
jgi:hypothetical protein